MLDYSETDEIFNIFAHFLAMLRPLSQNIMAKKSSWKRYGLRSVYVLSFTQRSAVDLTDSVLSKYAA